MHEQRARASRVPVGIIGELKRMADMTRMRTMPTMDCRGGDLESELEAMGGG